MGESIQKWLGRNRPPRVQITYDVETLGAIEMKELPFVLGILADLSGSTERAENLKERKFLEIDRDNFDQTMAKTIAPTLQVKVPDALKAAEGTEGENLVADLAFGDIDDFRPENIAMQVPALRSLLEARHALTDLVAQLDLREGLAEQLDQLVGSSEADLKALGAAADEELQKLRPEDGPAALPAGDPAAADPAAAKPEEKPPEAAG